MHAGVSSTSYNAYFKYNGAIFVYNVKNNVSVVKINVSYVIYVNKQSMCIFIQHKQLLTKCYSFLLINLTYKCIMQTNFST